ncbi:hypothetical protein D9M68_595820 [compost metagenome]
MDAVQLHGEVGGVEDAVVVGVGEQQGAGGADGVEDFGEAVIAEAEVAPHRGYAVAGALEDQAAGEAGEPQDVAAGRARAFEVGDAVLAHGAGFVTGFDGPEVAVDAGTAGEDVGATKAEQVVVAGQAGYFVVFLGAEQVVVIRGARDSSHGSFLPSVYWKERTATAGSRPYRPGRFPLGAGGIHCRLSIHPLVR